jgi:type VI secretion system secreted protein VgrG
VYDGANRAPVTLPAEQTRSVWRSRSSPGGEGYNQILMEDLAGSELLALHAHRDYLSETGRNSVTKVGADQSVEVGGNQSTVVTGGQTSVVEGSRGVSVRGEQNINVDGKYTLFAQDIVLSAAGEVHIQSAGDRYDTSNNHFIRSGSTYLESQSVVQVVAPCFHVFAKSEIHRQVGGSSIHITSGGIKITSSGNVDVNGAIVKLNCE